MKQCEICHELHERKGKSKYCFNCDKEIYDEIRHIRNESYKLALQNIKFKHQKKGE
jgi:hypothetical protein